MVTAAKMLLYFGMLLQNVDCYGRSPHSKSDTKINKEPEKHFAKTEVKK